MYFDFIINILWLQMWTAAFVMSLEQLHTTYWDYKAIKRVNITNGRRLIAQTSLFIIICLVIASGLNIVPGILALAVNAALVPEKTVELINTLCLVTSALCIVVILILKRRGRIAWEESQ